MKKLTLSLIALFAIGTTAMAESYPAYGPNSYKAQYGGGNTQTENTESVSTVSVGTHSRKGFRLSLGAGAAYTNIENYYLNGDDVDGTGFATSFEIGYAPTNQLSIQYMNNVNWGSSDTEISGVTGIVLNYYLDNSPETFYIVGGAGGAIYDDGSDEIEGAGIVGVGYTMDNIEFELDGAFNEYYGQSMMQIFFTVSYRFY